MFADRDAIARIMDRLYAVPEDEDAQEARQYCGPWGWQYEEQD